MKIVFWLDEYSSKGCILKFNLEFYTVYSTVYSFYVKAKQQFNRVYTNSTVLREMRF